ncbi:hypothetical protein FDP41_007784 [Naegleria fowleri]|uniref:Uncharacterized protein n=1 Tax=Naegleria fowleri TaxID=5763 RepID=A0A6A5CEX3_NAEFO|nr:uncharacterized protein FDP41_007784 [Naegleria fowleri]KAF0983869.1 hypothetical protein FDP41_007784 [Naegleria fowleri]CAG4716537.1 unnamed protein product [Naegleria fowleri]
MTLLVALISETVSSTELNTLSDSLRTPKPPTTRLTIQPESNGWWVQLKVSPPGVTQRIRVTILSQTGQTHTLDATSPSWDSTRSYFTAQSPQEIPSNSQVKFTVMKRNGRVVPLSMQWRIGNSVSSSSRGGGNSGNGGNGVKSSSSGRNIANATWYDETAAGTPVCGFKTKYCGAPSDAFKGLGVRVGPCWGGTSSSTCQNCAKGYCFGPSCVPPQCKKGGCGIKIKLWCVDPSEGACKTSEPIIMTVNNMCPKSHPCNTCKGKQNPCARSNHLDLCASTFFALANHQPRTEGLKIAYQVLGK